MITWQAETVFTAQENSLLEGISRGIRFSTGQFSLFLISYEFAFTRLQLLIRLEELLDQTRVLHIDSLPLVNANLIVDAILRKVRMHFPASPPQLVTISGIEACFERIASGGIRLSVGLLKLAQALNYSRNALAKELQCPLLLLLPKSAIKDFLFVCPDLASWIVNPLFIGTDFSRLRQSLEQFIDRIFHRSRQLTSFQFFLQCGHIASQLITEEDALRLSPVGRIRIRLMLAWFSIFLGDSNRAMEHFRDAHSYVGSSDRNLAASLNYQLHRMDSFVISNDVSMPIVLPTRVTQIRAILERLDPPGLRCLILWGPRGAGKSTLLKTDFVAMVHDHMVTKVVYVQVRRNLIQSVTHAIESQFRRQRQPGSSLREFLKSITKEQSLILILDEIGAYLADHRGDLQSALALKELVGAIEDFESNVKVILVCDDVQLFLISEFDSLMAEPLAKAARLKIDHFGEEEALSAVAHVFATRQRDIPSEVMRAGVKFISQEGKVSAPELKHWITFALSSTAAAQSQFELRYLRYLFVAISSGAAEHQALIKCLYQLGLRNDGMTLSDLSRELKFTPDQLLKFLEKLEDAHLLKKEEVSNKMRYFMGSAAMRPLITTLYAEIGDLVEPSLFYRTLAFVTVGTFDVYKGQQAIVKRLQRALSDSADGLRLDLHLGDLIAIKAFARYHAEQTEEARSLLRRVWKRKAWFICTSCTLTILCLWLAYSRFAY